MENIQLTPEQAVAMYINGNQSTKDFLVQQFGEDLFKEKDYSHITTVDVAIKETKRPTTPTFSEVPEDMRPYFIALYNMMVVSEAVNGGIRPNLYDESERWYPWYRTNGHPSRFGFYASSYVFSCAYAGSGSRLC